MSETKEKGRRISYQAALIKLATLPIGSTASTALFRQLKEAT